MRYKLCKFCENRARDTPLRGLYIPHFGQIWVKLSILGSYNLVVAPMGVKLDIWNLDQRSPPPCQISPLSAQRVAPCRSFTAFNELKDCLIAVWPDFRQFIIDTAADQRRKRLQACVRANGGHFEHFYEQTLANNLHFSCVFGSSGFYPSCQLFTLLMLDGR